MNSVRARVLLLVGILAGASFGGCSSSRDDGGPQEQQAVSVTLQWHAVPDMVFAREQPAATLLNDGRVFVSSNGTSEIFDLKSGGWTPASSLVPLRFGMTVTTLTNGSVLGVGDSRDSSVGQPRALRRYDVENDAWLSAGTTSVAYEGNHTATLLANGDVLLLGGATNCTSAPKSELVRRANGTVSVGPVPNFTHSKHVAVTLDDGRVFIVGGDCGPTNAEIFEPTGFKLARSMHESRREHTATLLKDGRVLVAGGLRVETVSVGRSSAEIYDPRTNTWKQAKPMARSRAGHTATLLADGRVIVIGGYDVFASGGSIAQVYASTEIYDPVADTWTEGPPLQTARMQHAAVQLANGSILVMGGRTTSSGSFGSATLKSVELLGAEVPPEKPTEARFNFLSRTGIGTIDSALAYYNAIAPDLIPAVPASAPPLDTSPAAISPGRRFTRDVSPTSLATTLDQWTRRFMGDISNPANVRTALYQNAVDLGFWREMVCTKVVARGQGGCRVRNWRDPADVGDLSKNLGTVAMSISKDGFTQFFVFGPDGFLSPVAKLDSEGFKAAPQVCTPCHAGRYFGPKSDGTMSAVFREFDPSMLKAVPGGDAEQDWFLLNQSVKSANEHLLPESEGGLLGVDHARLATNQYIDAMYPNNAPPALHASDPRLVPPSFDTPTRRSLYSTVLQKYCMPCHRSNALDFSDHSTVTMLGPTGGPSEPFFKLLIDQDPAHPSRFIPFMPQSELAYTTLKGDRLARSVIESWLIEQRKSL